jgi:hypothetical protein
VTLSCVAGTMQCMANNKRTPIEDRFWAKVEITGFCWNWTAGTTRGYGVISLGGRHGEKVYAHRWSYQHLVGAIPEGMAIDHLCRNILCVNPDHLEPVPNSENVRRGAVSRNKAGVCKYGHPLDYQRPDGHGRNCTTCNTERNGARYKSDPEFRERVLARQQAHREANKDRINARQRERRAARKAVSGKC